MSDNINLRAFIRLDGQGRVVAGSLIMRKNRPKVGHWMEIVKGTCCVPVVLSPQALMLQQMMETTTTSTTTAIPETTTTTTTMVVESTTTTTTTTVVF